MRPAKLKALRWWHVAMLAGALTITIAVFLSPWFILTPMGWLGLGIGVFIIGMSSWANPKRETAYITGAIARFFGVFIVAVVVLNALENRGYLHRRATAPVAVNQSTKAH